MSVPLAFSLFSTVVALVALVGTGRLVYDLRCAMRLEVLARDARNEIVEGLTTMDFEKTALAVANWDTKFVREIDAQIEHPWSMLRFWKGPPKIGVDWE